MEVLEFTNKFIKEFNLDGTLYEVYKKIENTVDEITVLPSMALKNEDGDYDYFCALSVLRFYSSDETDEGEKLENLYKGIRCRLG